MAEERPSGFEDRSIRTSYSEIQRQNIMTKTEQGIQDL